MMYRCENCGHLFEDGEQAVWEETHGLDHGPYEKWDGCPICKGGYEEVHQCKECGGWHTENELYEGWCEKCLRELTTHDIALDFLTESELLATFMFEKVWESSEPDNVSDKLKKVLRELFLRRKADDLLCSKSDFLNICKTYIFDDDGDFGKIVFAEWMKEREVK